MTTPCATSPNAGSRRWRCCIAGPRFSRGETRAERGARPRLVLMSDDRPEQETTRHAQAATTRRRRDGHTRTRTGEEESSRRPRPHASPSGPSAITSRMSRTARSSSRTPRSPAELRLLERDAPLPRERRRARRRLLPRVRHRRRGGDPPDLYLHPRSVAGPSADGRPLLPAEREEHEDLQAQGLQGVLAVPDEPRPRRVQARGRDGPDDVGMPRRPLRRRGPLRGPEPPADHDGTRGLRRQDPPLRPLGPLLPRGQPAASAAAPPLADSPRRDGDPGRNPHLDLRGSRSRRRLASTAVATRC